MLGYTRFWVAEHHNMPALASAAPDVLIEQIVAHITRIRLGRGRAAQSFLQKAPH